MCMARTSSRRRGLNRVCGSNFDIGFLSLKLVKFRTFKLELKLNIIKFQNDIGEFKAIKQNQHI